MRTVLAIAAIALLSLAIARAPTEAQTTTETGSGTSQQLGSMTFYNGRVTTGTDTTIWSGTSQQLGPFTYHTFRGSDGQLTTGKPIRVTSRVGRRRAAHVFDIRLDTRKNEPVVTHDTTLGQWDLHHGTRVELEIVANWQQGQRFVNRYIEHTALANPHATIHYTRPVSASQRAGTDKAGNETLSFPRAATD